METGLRPLAVPDGPHQLQVAQPQRELLVGDRLGERDARELVPHAQLELGAVEGERQVELLELAREVGVELLAAASNGPSPASVTSWRR